MLKENPAPAGFSFGWVFGKIQTMKVLIQKVKKASVTVNKQEIGSIGAGLLVFLGISKSDTEKDIDYLVNKIVNLRIFPGDGDSGFDKSVLEEEKEVLVVSQFTLYGSCDKGRRPDFFEAARPEDAEVLYDKFVGKMVETGVSTATGQFQAMMDVSLINDGPVTLILESK